MIDADDWARDPSVQMMRRVFSCMEKQQGKLLQQLCIAPFDVRLRKWRASALVWFEQVWISAANKGIHLGEEAAAAAYAHCLGRAIASEGVSVPLEALPKNEDIAMLLKEVLQ